MCRDIWLVLNSCGVIINIISSGIFCPCCGRFLVFFQNFIFQKLFSSGNDKISKTTLLSYTSSCIPLPTWVQLTDQLLTRLQNTVWNWSKESTCIVLVGEWRHNIWHFMVRKYNKIGLDNNFNLNTSNLKMSISLIRHIHGYNLITITVL